MKRVNFNAVLPVTVIREGDAFVAYTPVLDLSTVGETLESAKKNFHDAAQVFFEETYAMGTLNETLLEMGWRKDEQEWTPPAIISHESQSFQVPLHE